MSDAENPVREFMDRKSDRPGVVAPVHSQRQAYSAILLDQAPLFALAALCLATTLLSNRFLSPENITNILVQSSVMCVVAMGMTYVIVIGGFDLSVGSTVALSGCVAAWVMLHSNVLSGPSSELRPGPWSAS